MTTPILQESIHKTNEQKSLPKEHFRLPKEPLELPSPQAQQNDVKTLLSWTAPGRPFAKRGKQ